MFSDDSHQEDDDYLLDSSSSVIKRTLFQSLAPLLTEEYFNPLFKLLFLLIETLQLISFAFKPILIGLWKSPNAINTISGFFKYFMIMPYVEKSGFSSFLVVFYIVVGIMLGLVLTMIYLTRKIDENSHHSKAVNQNSAGFQIARAICELLSPVLFLPMIEVLIKIFDCSFDTPTARWIHNMFPEAVCFDGIYFLHVFLGGLCAVLLEFLTAALNMMFFEPRLKSHNFLAKANGRIAFSEFLYKTMLVVIFEILGTYNDVILLAYFTIVPFILFLRFREDFPFYNVIASKCYLLHHALITWTGFMSVFGKIVFDVNFDANIFIFFFGIGLLACIILLRKDFRYDLLLLNVNKTDSLELFEKHIHYLMLLCEHYSTDPALSVLLDGFLQFHRTICSMSDCPCKKEANSLRSSRKDIDMGTQDPQVLRVFSLVNVFFVNMLQKKPFNPGLRIKYALFLLDKLDQKQLALQELLSAGRFKPGVSEEFLIYRFKRLVEAELLEKKKEDAVNRQGFAMETVNELALNAIVKQLKLNVEKSAGLHLEFWSQLSEDVPDLGKLCEIGTRIDTVDQNIEEDWERFNRMNVILPSLFRLFASFLFTIFSDKVASGRVFSRLEGEAGGRGRQLLHNTLASELVNNSMPVVFVGAENANLGVITNLNQAAAGLLGYSKSELLNKRLTSIQPISIAEKHDSFIENYLAKSETRMLNKELLLPCKDKTGYLKPVFITARSVPFAMQGLQFFALMRVEKSFRTSMQLFCDAEGVIELFSSSCLNFLGLDKKKLAKKRNLITEVIPGFFDNLPALMDKHGSMADVQIQAKVANNLTHYTTTMPSTLNYQTLNPKNLKESAVESQGSGEIGSGDNFNRSNDEIDLTRNLDKGDQILALRMPVLITLFENKAFGLKSYLVRIEYKEKKPQMMPHKLKVPNQVNNNNMLNTPNSVNRSPMPKNPFFSIRFDINLGGYRGELLEGEEGDIDNYLNFLQTSHLSGRSILENSEMQSDSVRNQSKLFKKLEENLQMRQKEMQNNQTYEFKDLGKGIRTYRLLGDRVYDIEELKRDEESGSGSEENLPEAENKSNLQQESSLKTNEREDPNANLKNSRSIFKSRANFNNFLRRLKGEKSGFVRNLHWCAVASLLIVGIVSSVNHFLMANQFSVNQNSYSLMDWSNQRISESQLILHHLIELHLLSLGLYNNSDFFNGYENQERLNLKAEILQLENLQNQLLLNSFGLNPAHAALDHQNSIKTGYISSGSSNVTFQKFDLNQITAQVISKAYAMADKPLNSFASLNADSDFFFLRYNLINDYYLAQREESDLFLSELRDRIVENSTILLAMLLLSAFVLILSLLVLFPLHSFAISAHHELLCVFLDVPINQVKRQFTRCEAFLNHLQVGEEEEEAEEAGDGSDQGSVKSEEEHGRAEGLLGLTSQKKRKKFRVNSRTRMLFFAQVLVILGVIEAFFIANYEVTNQFSYQIDNIINELNVTSLLESHFGFANNLLKQNIIDQRFSVDGKSNVSTDLAGNYTDILISLVSSAEKLHSLDLGYQDSGFNAVFDQVFWLNLCGVLFDETQCLGFADSAFSQGLSLALYRFINNFRELNGYVNMVRQGLLTDLSLVGSASIFVPSLSNQLNLLNLANQRENNAMQQVYLKGALRHLVQSQLDSIKNNYSNTMNNRLALYVCFIVLLMLVYLGFWVPIVGQLNMGMYRIKRMLAIVPLEIIQNNKQIRENIQGLLNIHD